jgi:hypothetical protein
MDGLTPSRPGNERVDGNFEYVQYVTWMNCFLEAFNRFPPGALRENVVRNRLRSMTAYGSERGMTHFLEWSNRIRRQSL